MFWDIPLQWFGGGKHHAGGANWPGVGPKKSKKKDGKALWILNYATSNPNDEIQGQKNVPSTLKWYVITIPSQYMHNSRTPLLMIWNT